MSRSPLAYPLNRGIDGDAGGAADLQTDIMRFMAILALCLVAIFALVQSIPLAPETAPLPTEPVASELPTPPVDIKPEATAAPPRPERVVLTRPKRQPQPRPERPAATAPAAVIEPAPTADPKPALPPDAAAEEGFTLRFASDHALARLVAASQVGFYAITPGRTQRMAVSDSRISFWDASTPNLFHEMEAATVPRPVLDALARTGVDTSAVDWGVTLPGRLSRQLDSLTHEHTGGALVIAADGQLRLESQ